MNNRGSDQVHSMKNTIPQKEQKNELEIVVPWLHSKYVGVFSPPLYFVEELKHKTFDGLFILQQESLPD